MRAGTKGRCMNIPAPCLLEWLTEVRNVHDIPELPGRVEIQFPTVVTACDNTHCLTSFLSLPHFSTFLLVFLQSPLK